MLDAFSRDIRSIRAQENIGVHSGAPLLVEHFPENSDPYLYGPIVAVRLRANLEAHSWTNERPVMGRPRVISLPCGNCPLRGRAGRHRYATGFSLHGVTLLRAQ